MLVITYLIAARPFYRKRLSVAYQSRARTLVDLREKTANFYYSKFILHIITNNNFLIRSIK